MQSKRPILQTIVLLAFLAAIFAATIFWRPNHQSRESDRTKPSVGERSDAEGFVLCLNSATNFLEEDNVFVLPRGVPLTEMNLIILNMGKDPLTNVWLSLKISN